MDGGAQTRPGEGGVRVCVRAGERKDGARGRQLWPWWAGRGERRSRRAAVAGKGHGEDGGGSPLCAGGCQPEGHRGWGWAGGPGQGEGAWGSWRVVRAGRQASVPEAYSALVPRSGWCAVSPVLSASSSDSRASLGEHPWEETFWVPGLRTGRVACGVVASHSATKAFSWLRGFIFRHLCPHFPAPDSFTSCLVLTSPL